MNRIKQLLSFANKGNGEGNGDRLLYSCLGNPMNKGAWKVTVHKVAKSLI